MMARCICPDDGEWCEHLRQIRPGAFAPDNAPEPYYCWWEGEPVDVGQSAPEWCPLERVPVASEEGEKP